jgi:hypothetical protein
MTKTYTLRVSKTSSNINIIIVDNKYSENSQLIIKLYNILLELDIDFNTSKLFTYFKELTNKYINFRLESYKQSIGHFKLDDIKHRLTYIKLVIEELKNSNIYK